MNYDYPTTVPTYPERITRSTYFVRGLLYLFGSTVACLLITAGFGGHHVHLFGLVFGLAGALLMVVLFVGLFRFVLIPRIRDIGLEPAWAWSLLFFLHSLGLLFLIALLVLPTNAFARRSSYYYRRPGYYY